MIKLFVNPILRAALAGGILAGAMLATLPAGAQNAPADFPTIPAALEKKLAARASNVDEVTLNKNMLNFAGQFMNGKKKDDRQAQQIVKNLDGIYVRDFEFKTPGAYTQEDLKTIRRQFLGPQWTAMVHSSEKNGESSDVYVKMVDGKVHGMFVLSAEPKELSLVYLSGSIDPSQLGALGGNFGVPKIDTGGKSAPFPLMGKSK